MEHDPPKTHKITALSVQTRNPNRVNVSVDGKYRFSLDISQVTDLGVKVGRCVTAVELAELEAESQFGKLYARTLEYCLARPHSVHEVRDYLQRKTVARRYKSRRTGQIKEHSGVDRSVADRVLVRLREKGYVDDEECYQASLLLKALIAYLLIASLPNRIAVICRSSLKLSPKNAAVTQTSKNLSRIWRGKVSATTTSSKRCGRLITDLSVK